MIITILVLVVFTLMGGYFALLVGFNPGRIRYPLIFAGSFLFSITIIHILPEVFSLSENPLKVGLFILGGFFFQQFLEYFTSGIEHGHFHSHGTVSTASRFSLVIALVVHSLLEGALLTHDSPFHERHESYSLLLGILLHKVPAAFALMASLKDGKRFTVMQWTILGIFSLSSPVGLILSDSIISLSAENLIYLFAVVSGSFLHISTTIFVESSPEHHFGLNKLLISLLGAGLAIFTEYLV